MLGKTHDLGIFQEQVRKERRAREPSEKPRQGGLPRAVPPAEGLDRGVLLFPLGGLEKKKNRGRGAK